MRVIRTLALSGAAAAALLGAAGTATADTAEEPTVTVQAAVDRAAGAPVTLPSGGTIHVTGMESSGYRAEAGHRDAVVRIAAATDKDPGDPVAPGEGNNPDGNTTTAPPSGQPNVQQPNGEPNGLQQPNPYQQQRTTYDPNVQNAAGGGALAGTAVAALVLIIFTYFAVKKSGLGKGHMFMCVALGVLLAPTFVGPLVTQITGSGVSTFGNLWAGM